MAKNSRTKSFASNAVWSFILQLVTILAGFVIPRVIIGTYGSQMNGLVTSLTQMVGYISLVEAGISAAAVFALYKPLANEDWNAVSVIVSAAKTFYYKSGLAFIALAAILAIAYPLAVDCSPLLSWQVAMLVVALCASGFLDFFLLAKYRVLLTADQRNWVIQIASIVYRILYMVIILIMARYHSNLECVYSVAIVAIIARTAILVVYARRKYPQINFSAKHERYKLDQRWDAFVLQILGAIQSGFPILVVTFVIGDLRLVSIYAVYMLVANGIIQLCAAITSGTQASFGDVIARNETATLQRTYSELGSLMGILNSSAAGTAAVMIVPFVMLYTGDIADVNYSAPVLGVLVMTDAFLYHLKTPEGLLVIAAGKYRESRPFVIGQTFVLVICSVIGAMFFGLEGVVVGCCLANVYAAIYLNFFIPNRVTGTKKMLTTKKHLVTIFAFAPSVIIAWMQIITAADWGVWILQCLAIAAIMVTWALCVFFVFDRGTTVAAIKRIGLLLQK